MNRFWENNLYVKILALFLAVILWIYVVNEQSPRIQRTFTVKLETRNVAPGLVVTQAPDLVEIRVSGLRNTVLGLVDKDIRAYLDLQGIEEGEYFLPVKTHIPRGVELLQVKPDRVRIELERVISKNVTVRPQVKGTALGQYAVVGAMAQEQNALVQGPRSKVEETVQVWAVVNLNEIRGATSAQGRMIAVNHRGQIISGLEITPETTLVTIPTLPVKEVSVKARIKGNPAAGFVVRKVIIEPSNLRIAGDRSQLERIQTLETENIDLAGISSNLQKEVVVTVPEGVTLIDRNRVKVLVVVGQGEESQVFSGISVTVYNLPENWQVKVNPERVDVWLKGPTNLLKQVRPEQISVVVDAAELEREGEVSLVPKITVPSGLNLERIKPDQLLITLRKNG